MNDNIEELCEKMSALHVIDVKVSFKVTFHKVQYHIPYWRLRTLNRRIIKKIRKRRCYRKQ